MTLWVRYSNLAASLLLIYNAVIRQHLVLLMNNKDYLYAQEIMDTFKQCIISNIGNTGLLVQRFQIRLEDIKEATNRIRLSPAIVDDYMDYLNHQGVTAFFDGVGSIMCEVDLTKVYLTQNEALKMSRNIENYNIRLAYEQSENS